MNKGQNQNKKKFTINVVEGKLPENISVIAANTIAVCLDENENISSIQEIAVKVRDADTKLYTGEIVVDADLKDIVTNGAGIKLPEGLYLELDEIVSESEKLFLYENEKVDEVMKELQQVIFDNRLSKSDKGKKIDSKLVALNTKVSEHSDEIPKKANSTKVGLSLMKVKNKFFMTWFAIAVLFILSIVISILIAPTKEDIIDVINAKLEKSNYATAVDVSTQIQEAIVSNNTLMTTAISVAVQPFKDSVTSMNASISNINGELKNLGITVGELADKTTSFKNDIKALKGDLDKIDKFTKSVEKRVTSHGKRLNTIDTTLNEHNATIQRVNESIADFFSIEAKLNSVIHNQALLKEAECDDWSKSEKICTVFEDGWKKVFLLPVENNTSTESNSSNNNSEIGIVFEEDTSIEEI